MALIKMNTTPIPSYPIVCSSCFFVFVCRYNVVSIHANRLGERWAHAWVWNSADTPPRHHTLCCSHFKRRNHLKADDTYALRE
jgi:hypothetical protein